MLREKHRLTNLRYFRPACTNLLEWAYFPAAGAAWYRGGTMTIKPDAVYYAERLAAELAALEAATNDAARRAHQELVEQYRQLVAACAAQAGPAAE
jgi:hypothetical protein